MKGVQKPSLFLLLLHISLLFLLPLNAASSPRTQAEALIRWKNNFVSSPPSLNSWSLTDLNNLCNWTAIACDHNTKTISQVDLSNFNITATLTHFHFTPFLNLTQFNLNGNNFTGPIPSAIGNLSKLTTLDLGNNLFNQEIPAQIGMLTELQYFSFFNNNLTGLIPYQLSSLQKQLWRGSTFPKIRTGDGGRYLTTEVNFLALDHHVLLLRCGIVLHETCSNGCRLQHIRNLAPLYKYNLPNRSSI